MAANINNSAQRFDYARAERDDENNNSESATPDGQTPPQSETTIATPSEQQGQSSGDGASSDAGTHDSSTPPPLPEENIPLPAQFRYGLGEVSIGRPDYTRVYADRAQQGEREPSPREAAFAPTPRAEDTPPPFALPALPANLFNDLPIPLDTTDFGNAAPLQTAFTSVDVTAARIAASTLAGAPNASTATPAATSTKPIPMPKPGGTMSPTSASLPASAATVSPNIINAPRIGGEAVRQALAADQRNSQSATGTAPTASDAELDAIDAMLADPINKQLIDLARQNMGPAPTNNAVADAQIKRYGEARFQDMMYLHRELPAVQNAYAQAVTEAYLANRQPALTGNLSNNQGTAPPPSTFDINAFTKEYESRSDLMAQAFAAKFGGMPITQETGFSGTVSGGDSGDMSGAYVPIFHVGNLFDVSMVAQFQSGASEGGGLALPPTYTASTQPPGATGELYTLGPDIGDHKALFDDTAVWFDPSLGFVTHRENMKPDEVSNFDRVVEVAGQAFFVYCAVVSGTAFLLGPEGATVLGFSANSWQAGAIRGAVQAGIGTVASSTYSGRTLTLAEFGRSIFTGGVMGGLVNYANLNTYGITTQNGVQVTNWGERLTAILGRSTMQGILQQVTGGRFQDGLRNGLASSLSNELSRTLGAQINQWAADNHVDPFIASQLRMVAQGFSSALVQTAANGGQAGVEAFLNDLISGELGADGDRQRAEINGLTEQYNEAVKADDYTTQADVLNNLVERWMNNHRDATPQEALAHVTEGLGWTVDEANLVRDDNGRIAAIENISTEARQILASADADLDSLDNGINENIFGTQVAAGNGNATDAQSPLNIVNNPLLSLAQRLNLVERDLSVIDGRITEFTRLEAEARASGNTALANRYQDRVDEFLSRQSQYREATQMLGTARTAQSFSESLYSNDRGYSREQIDAAMNRILRRELPEGGADEFVRNQMVGNNPGLWASLNDPEGLALIVTAGSIGRALTRGTPSVSNYRTLFRQNRPDMPPDYQVHHSIPQKYADRMAAEGINIHEVQYLRGIDRDTHTRITALWETFGRQNNGNPSIAQIQNFARQIDQQFGSKFVWPK